MSEGSPNYLLTLLIFNYTFSPVVCYALGTCTHGTDTLSYSLYKKYIFDTAF